MKTLNLIAALSFACASASSFAADVRTDVTGNFFEFTNLPSSHSRAEVRSDIALQATPRSEFVEFGASHSGLTRQEVVAARNTALAIGTVQNAAFVDAKDFVIVNGRSRAEVKAEAMQFALNRAK